MTCVQRVQIGCPSRHFGFSVATEVAVVAAEVAAEGLGLASSLKSREYVSMRAMLAAARS